LGTKLWLFSRLVAVALDTAIALDTAVAVLVLVSLRVMCKLPAAWLTSNVWFGYARGLACFSYPLSHDLKSVPLGLWFSA
jgi:hypothetical protein